MSTGDDPVWMLPFDLSSLRPESAELWHRVNEHAWNVVDPVMLELIRLRIAGLIGNRVGDESRSQAARALGLSEEKIGALAAYPSSSHFSPVERECLSFAELFVIDVSATPAVIDAVARSVGSEHIESFVSALYVIEFTQRLQLMAVALLGRTGPSRPAATRQPGTECRIPSGSSLRGALAEYQSSVVRGDALDPATTELVRLRCARTHHCRICQTLRLDDARAAGVDETITSKIDFYETSDLPERYKDALRITDAFITRPDMLSEARLEQARSRFTPDELAEICFDITKWSTQKIHVALGQDSAEALPTNEDGISFFSFDQNGTVAGFSAR